LKHVKRDSRNRRWKKIIDLNLYLNLYPNPEFELIGKAKQAYDIDVVVNALKKDQDFDLNKFIEARKAGLAKSEMEKIIDLNLYPNPEFELIGKAKQAYDIDVVVNALKKDQDFDLNKLIEARKAGLSKSEIEKILDVNSKADYDFNEIKEAKSKLAIEDIMQILQVNKNADLKQIMKLSIEERNVVKVIESLNEGKYLK